MFDKYATDKCCWTCQSTFEYIYIYLENWKMSRQWQSQLALLTWIGHTLLLPSLKRRRRQFHLLAKAWHQFFEMHVGSTSKKNKRRVLCELITAFEWWYQVETAAFGEKESVLLSRQCTSSHIRYRDDQNQWVKVQIASSRTLFARFSPVGLFSVSELEKSSVVKDLPIVFLKKSPLRNKATYQLHSSRIIGELGLGASQN